MPKFVNKLYLSAPVGSRRQTVLKLLVNGIKKHNQLKIHKVNEEEASITIIYEEE